MPNSAFETIFYFQKRENQTDMKLERERKGMRRLVPGRRVPSLAACLSKVGSLPVTSIATAIAVAEATVAAEVGKLVGREASRSLEENQVRETLKSLD